MAARRTSDSLSRTDARRIAISAAGIKPVRDMDPASAQRSATAKRVEQCLRSMHVLQIDAINTVIRSHYLPIFSRIGHYDVKHLDAPVFDPARQTPQGRKFFEYWGHECSVMPLELYPLLRWRMEDARNGTGLWRQLAALAAKRPAFVQYIRELISDQGPLTSRQLEDGGRGSGMWEWSESKQALEYLFWTGDLTCIGRRNFERLYELPERSMPSAILNHGAVDRLTAHCGLIERSAAALGVADVTDLRDYFRLPARDMAAAIDVLVESKRLVPVTVEGWSRQAYVLPGTRVPARSPRVETLLTPFDPLVWRRERSERLFNFHYRIEIYVPAKQRRYGYYVLPFLLRDRLCGRVDLRTDREQGVLRVLGAWSEMTVNADETARALLRALQRLAHWLDVHEIHIGGRGNLGPLLRRHQRELGV